MILNQTGMVCENFFVIGSSHVPVYLLDGFEPVLFDAGLSAFAHRYEDDIKKILGDRKPAWLLITHSHFDHIGAVSHLKEIWPDLKVGGSERCREILSKPKANQLIGKLNREALESHKKLGTRNLDERPYEPFELDFLVNPGNCTTLPGNIRAIHTPGHTWDFFSYWVEEGKILIASEAVACREPDGHLQAEFLVDFDIYLNSLQTLSALDANVLCPGHHFVLTGRDVITHIQASLEAANYYRTMTEKFLGQENGDIERAVTRIKAWQWDDRSWPKQPESAYLLNTRQRVKIIRERMGREAASDAPATH
jgi:glyoxylase-like metal-dependent hydrolase (beta-lactamase superfamily II)